MTRKKKPKLTVKQELFVCLYLSNGGNASAAARDAGYSEKSARVVGTENLTKPAIKAAIDARRSIALDKYEVTVERVLEEMAKMAFINMKELYDLDTGLLIPIHLLPDKVAASIIEVTEKSYGKGEPVFERKYKVSDKKGMLDLLAKYLKMYSDDDDAGAVKVEPPKINIYFPDNGRGKKKK